MHQLYKRREMHGPSHVQYQNTITNTTPAGTDCLPLFESHGCGHTDERTHFFGEFEPCYALGILT
jgi:hypothetical protein